jgi:hypothetical protein
MNRKNELKFEMTKIVVSLKCTKIIAKVLTHFL